MLSLVLSYADSGRSLETQQVRLISRFIHATVDLRRITMQS